MPEKKPECADSYPKEVIVTAAMVRCNASVRASHLRDQRLNALARQNPDVAWLLKQKALPPVQASASEKPSKKNAEK